MPLYYITGVSGTGKSTICSKLKKHGYVAYDVDEDVYAQWIDRATGEVVEYPGDDSFEIHEWYKNHRWVIDEDKIEQLHKQAELSTKPVFLCGAGAGDKAVWPLFKKVFALIVDTDTLKYRLAYRTGNDFGKTSEELQEVLEWHEGYEERHRKRGSVLIDATQAMDAVVKQILTQIND